MKLPHTLLVAVAVAGCQDSLASGRGAPVAPVRTVAEVPVATPPKAPVSIIPEATQPLAPVRTVSVPPPSLEPIGPVKWETWDCPQCGRG
ncbi:MAG: hypothetical protein R3F61_09360 [Myxococcota bacterium]